MKNIRAKNEVKVKKLLKGVIILISYGKISIKKCKNFGKIPVKFQYDSGYFSHGYSIM
jgi:hypothetical protein